MTLIMLICLAAQPAGAPAQCRTEQVPTEAAMPMQCTMAAQQWALGHPRWRLEKWRCGRRVVEI